MYIKCDFQASETARKSDFRRKAGFEISAGRLLFQLFEFFFRNLEDVREDADDDLGFFEF